MKAAFQKTLAVRTKGTEARELADQFFFETVVRIHRQGEDAPHTGFKPAGAHADPAIEKADQALQSGDISPALNLITAEATEGIRKRFAHVREKQKHAEESVDAGREYVEAYVDYIHYLEGLFEAAHRNKPHERLRLSNGFPSLTKSAARAATVASKPAGPNRSRCATVWQC